MNGKSRTLTREEVESFGREVEALRDEVVADLGQRDVDHIRGVIRTARYSEVAGRALLNFGIDPISFTLGVGALSLAKILENMEIGHNVMHGQYDWSKDPQLNSQTYEWDNVCTGDDWRHSHNFEHHTFTNILGKDRDVGYGTLRMSGAQPWKPVYLPQPIYALLLALAFQWGVGAHDLRIDEVVEGKQSLGDLRKRAKPFLRKAGWQLFKDYGLFPALALWNAPRVLAGNFLANIARNLWTFSVIFCGHFPDGVRVYTEQETANETRGDWYLRQISGSANFDGSRLIHILTGHLSHQIEHHVFPDLPGARYPEISPKLQEICARYDQAYNTDSFTNQFATVVKRIFRYALPLQEPEQAAI